MQFALHNQHQNLASEMKRWALCFHVKIATHEFYEDAVESLAVLGKLMINHSLLTQISLGLVGEGSENCLQTAYV